MFGCGGVLDNTAVDLVGGTAFNVNASACKVGVVNISSLNNVADTVHNEDSVLAVLDESI